jgi:hypothetical protein
VPPGFMARRYCLFALWKTDLEAGQTMLVPERIHCA